MGESVIVVIPTFNEAKNIGLLVDQILVLPMSFHILVVDDSSPDGTQRIVRQHPEFQKRIFLKERPAKSGLGKAYIDGFQWALEKGYSFICQMDADFSHAPKDLERLYLANQESRIDWVIGSRYIKGGGLRGWAWHRSILSKTANLYARLVTGIPIYDLTGGFKSFRRDVLAAIDLPSIQSEGYGFQIEVNARASRKNLVFQEVPIVFSERREGESKISRKILWEALWLVLRLRI